MDASIKVKRILQDEFDDNPVGHHSLELQKVLNVIRSEPISSRYVLICIETHKMWVLGELPGVRGRPVKVHEDKVFRSIIEAEQAVFRLRTKRHALRLKELDLTE